MSCGPLVSLIMNVLVLTARQLVSTVACGDSTTNHAHHSLGRRGRWGPDRKKAVEVAEAGRQPCHLPVCQQERQQASGALLRAVS